MSQRYVNQTLDTTYTKIYVGGLPWKTKEDGLRSHFEQFGEIVHVNVVCNNVTGRSEGYGFVTFRDVASAQEACQNPHPIIDGRQAKCNLAYLGARVNNNQNGQQMASYVVPYYIYMPDPYASQFYPQVYSYDSYPPYYGPHGQYLMN